MDLSRFFARLRAVMSPLIKLLLEGGKLNTAQMAQVLNLPEAEVNRQLEQLRADRVLLGWRPVLNLADEVTGASRRNAVADSIVSPTASAVSTKWNPAT